MPAGEFAVPTKPEDLLGEAGGVVCVKEIDTDDALRQLNGVVDCLCDGPTSIAEPENFNVLYALLRGFADIGDHVKSRVFDVLLSGLSCLAVHSDSLAAAPPGSRPASEFLEARNALRIHAFYLKWMASLAERAAGDTGQETKAPAARGKGKGKAAAAKPKGRVMDAWTWDMHRVKLLQGMRNLLLANLERVWSPVRPEEQFASLFVSTAIAALEAPAVAKDKEARAAAVSVLLRCASVMEQKTAVVGGVMNLIHNHEHMPSPAVDLVVAAAQQGERDFVSEMMREFGCLPMPELARDTAAAKNYAAFLGELAEMMPGLVLSHMSVVNPHLQLGESYVMRNAVLHAIGQTLIEMSRMIQHERTETALKTREALLQIMRERVNEISFPKPIRRDDKGEVVVPKGKEGKGKKGGGGVPSATAPSLSARKEKKKPTKNETLSSASVAGAPDSDAGAPTVAEVARACVGAAAPGASEAFLDAVAGGESSGVHAAALCAFREAVERTVAEGFAARRAERRDAINAAAVFFEASFPSARAFARGAALLANDAAAVSCADNPECIQ